MQQDEILWAEDDFDFDDASLMDCKGDEFEYEPSVPVLQQFPPIEAAHKWTSHFLRRRWHIIDLITAQGLDDEARTSHILTAISLLRQLQELASNAVCLALQLQDSGSAESYLAGLGHITEDLREILDHVKGRKRTGPQPAPPPRPRPSSRSLKQRKLCQTRMGKVQRRSKGLEVLKNDHMQLPRRLRSSPLGQGLTSDQHRTMKEATRHSKQAQLQFSARFSRLAG